MEFARLGLESIKIIIIIHSFPTHKGRSSNVSRGFQWKWYEFVKSSIPILSMKQLATKVALIKNYRRNISQKIDTYASLCRVFFFSHDG